MEQKERRVIIVGKEPVGVDAYARIKELQKMYGEIEVIEVDGNRLRSIPKDMLIIDDVYPHDKPITEDSILRYLDMVEKAMMNGELDHHVCAQEPLALNDLALRDPIEFTIDHKIYVPKSRRERRMNQRPYKYHK